MKPYTTLVVGGGVSGLVAARDASCAGQRVLLIEAGANVGGSVTRDVVGGVEVELGADAFAHARPEIAVLAKELGIAEQIVSPHVYQAFLRRNGTNVPLPPSLMGVPLDYDTIGDVLGVDAAKTAAARDAQPLPADLPESFGELLRLRLGDTVVEQMIDPVVSGVHASPADVVETVSILPGFPDVVRRHGSVVAAARHLRGTLGSAGAPVSGFTRGMSSLIGALRDDLDRRGVTVKTSTAAHRIRYANHDFVVDTADASYTAKNVIVALPAHAARAVFEGPDRAKTAQIRDLLGAFDTTDVTLVALLVRLDGFSDTDTPVGSGVLVAPKQPDVRAKALTHVSAKWADVRQNLPQHTHLFRLSYGGTEPAPDLDEHQLVALARNDLAALLHTQTQAVSVDAARVVQWKAALTRPTVGRMATVAALDAVTQEIPGVAFVGNAYAGNGLAGVVGRARREASRILKGV